MSQKEVPAELDVSDRDDYMSKTLDKLEKSVEKVDEKCDTIEKTLIELSTRFTDHLKQDEKMYEEFKNMVNILQENTESLKEHVMRTNLLQDQVLKMDARLAPIEQERIKSEAIREFVTYKAKKWGKILGVVGTIAGIVAALAKIFWGIG